MNKRHLGFLVFMAILMIGAGWLLWQRSRPPNPLTSAQTSFVKRSEASDLPIRFVDITEQAGIHFVHNNGAFGKKYLPETMGSGCAFLDYNNDGWQDILLVNAMDWPGHRRRSSFMALYRNNQNGTFTDVTRAAGLAVEMYGMGCAVGDYDNDGDADIYISCLGPDHLFRNNGDGTFADVTREAGLGNPEFGSSCAWFDYDRDGDLDLFVCNYVKWSIETDLFCTLDGVNKSYCTPESYDGVSSRLYRNRGDGTFEDVTQAAGLFDETNKALGVVVFDYDQDGWPDVFVANDTQPDKLYHNNADGTFAEKGVEAGVAFSEAGVARAGMGVDAADYDGSGFPSLIVGNFSNEMLGLYHNEGVGLFIDEAPTSAVGQASLLTLAFGCFFFDFDLDGWVDLFVANGHVADDIHRVQQQVTYAQPPHLFRNVNGNWFEEVTHRVGNELSRPLVARGAAYADIDNDGDLDLLVTTNGGPAHLFRNEGGERHHFLKFHTIGTRSNRDGIGTKIVIHLSDGRKQWRRVKSGMSYCSQSERTVTFGLGRDESVDRVEIFWPSGLVEQMGRVQANQRILLREGETSLSPQVAR